VKHSGPLQTCNGIALTLPFYILKSVGEKGQPWRTPLFISTGFDSLLLNFINILFCA